MRNPVGFEDLFLFLAHGNFNHQESLLCIMPEGHEKWIQELISFNCLIPNVGDFTL